MHKSLYLKYCWIILEPDAPKKVEEHMEESTNQASLALQLSEPESTKKESKSEEGLEN